MTLDEYKRQQKESLDRFKRLAKEDRLRATSIAERRLRAAGIIDEHNRLISR